MSEHEHGHHHDHNHTHHHVERDASKRALTVSLLVLSVFFVVELVGGLYTNSLALVSDAGHLLTDVGAIVLALFAQWMAKRPASAQRSYGFKRAEILAALFNGLTLWLVAVLIGVEAVQRFWHPPEVNSSSMIIIASVGLGAQSLVSWILHRAKGESLNVRAAYLHALTDALQSVGVIAAGVLMLFTQAYWIDPAISIIVAVLIFWGGGRLVVEASHVLLEGTPKELDLHQIIGSMRSIDGVQDVTDLHAWSITTGDNALSAHVIAQDHLSAEQRDLLRCAIDAHLRKNFPVQHITLQVERNGICGNSHCCKSWALAQNSDP